jgi:uncharacterized protein YkwD
MPSIEGMSPPVHLLPRTVALAVIAAATVLVGSAAARQHHRLNHGHAHRLAVQTVPRFCAGADVPAVGASVSSMRTALVCLINQQRVHRGLPRLRDDARLDRSAQGWTARMVATETFSHGADFAARISDAGLVWQRAGENIATGFVTPRAVVTAWMASVDHCQNILNPSYADVGSGINPHPVLGFAARGATWTQDFALPMGSRVPSRNWAPSRGCPY